MPANITTLKNVLSLKNDFDLFVFDVFGVLWDGSRLYENAAAHLAALKQAGKKVVILSNGTERVEAMEKSQSARGLEKGVHYDRIFSSGELAYRCFSADRRRLKYYVYGIKEAALFAGSRYVEVSEPAAADFVFIGIPKVRREGKAVNVLTVEPFKRELRKFAAQGLTLICANPDLRAYVGGYDEPVVCQGSLARYYEEVGGETEYFGKPYPEMFVAALEGYEDIAPERILMVGDTLETDILGAASLGLKTALTTSGISYKNMTDEGEFDDLRAYMKDLRIEADYLLESV